MGKGSSRRDAWPCVFMRKPMACRLGKAARYGILICGRDWRGPPQAGCASNGAGRVPRFSQRSFKRPRKAHTKGMLSLQGEEPL